MVGSLSIPAAVLFGFLLVLTRVSAAMAFVPIPGFTNMPLKARVVLALGITMAMSSIWPSVVLPSGGLGWLVLCMLGEATIGAAVGLAIAFLNEAFVLASQVFGLQALGDRREVLDIGEKDRQLLPFRFDRHVLLAPDDRLVELWCDVFRQLARYARP